MAESDDHDGIPWAAFVVETERHLAAAGLPNAAREARWIVEEATGADRLDEVLDAAATTRGVAALDRMVGRRLAGVPIQYVLGHWPFRSLDLLIDERVLIPRPETEIVAGHAIDEALAARRRRDLPVVVDLGAGSGAIGLSVAAEVPELEVWLVERSTAALAVARANLAGLGRRAAGVRLVEGSWFEPLPDELEGAVSVIVSNPPYVAPDAELDPSVLDHEPAEALFADEAGYADLHHLVDEAPRWLEGDGALVLEMDPSQTEPVAARCRRVFASVDVHTDLAGLARSVVARRPIRPLR